MRRHLRYQKRFSVLTIAIVVVILGIVGAIGWHTNHQQKKPHAKPVTPVTRATYHKPADPISAAADSFIIEKVGQDRFLQYFKLIAPSPPGATLGGLTTPADSTEGGFRSYHFSPLKIITADDTVIVLINLKTPIKTVASIIPDCRQDASLCDFNVTKKQALAIAQKNKFSPADLNLSWSTPTAGTPALAIKLASCSEKKVMFIDYRNGNVLESRAEPACP